MATQETPTPNKDRKNAKARREHKRSVAKDPKKAAAAEGSKAASAAESGGKIAWLRSFLKSVANEYKRVTWPSKLELRAATIVVLFTLVLFATYLGFFNFLFDAVFTAIGY